MDCPKCGTPNMVPAKYGRDYTVHRCDNCKALWFPEESYKQLKQEWMSQALDIGDPKVGKQYNKLTNINSPITGKPMQSVVDKQQPHIRYEIDVDGHGALFDAGEFTDYVEDTLSDFFKSFFAKVRGKDKPTGY